MVLLRLPWLQGHKEHKTIKAAANFRRQEKETSDTLLPTLAKGLLALIVVFILLVLFFSPK
jgi:hypothetical protein